MFKCGYLSGGLWIASGGSEVFPCCFIDGAPPLNDTNLEPINEDYLSLINNKYLLSMRKDAIKGITPNYCKTCIKFEQFGIKSKRQESLVKFTNEGFIKEHINISDIEYINYRISNICNFKCIMCNHSNSHLIGKEQKIGKIISSEDQFDKFIYLLQNASNLKNLTIAGGEPFYNRTRFKKIIEHAPDGISFNFLTNSSIYDEHILHLMRKFSVARICLSIDGEEDVFEYQRVNGKWSEILENIIKFYNYCQTQNISRFELHCNYSVTCFTLHNILKFIDKYNKYFKNINLSLVTRPKEFNINLITESELQQLLPQFTHLNVMHQAIKDAIKNPPEKETVIQLLKTINYMETNRKVVLEEKIPDAYNWLKCYA